jgi:hypothetical protein
VGLTISVKQPFEGQRVRSWIGLRTTVSSPSQVRSVEYVIDGRSWSPPLVGTAQPDFWKPWQSSTIANGAHTIVARASLTNGSTVQSAVRRFTTANGSSSSSTNRTTSGSQTAVSASADSTVAANRTTGVAQTLVVDAAPVMRSYLRFDLRSLRGKVRSAKLKLYVRTGSRAGFMVRAAGARVASGPAKSRAWKVVDVTLLVKPGRVAGLVLTTSSRSGLVFASSEARGKGPKLMIQTT